MDIEIRQATPEDINKLNRYLPVNIPYFHENKISEQQKNESVWLIAWKNDIPVGHLQVRWSGSKISKVKNLLIIVLILNRLELVRNIEGKELVPN